VPNDVLICLNCDLMREVHCLLSSCEIRDKKATISIIAYMSKSSFFEIRALCKHESHIRKMDLTHLCVLAKLSVLGLRAHEILATSCITVPKYSNNLAIYILYYYIRYVICNN
jgi:hypothetical protein